LLGEVESFGGRVPRPTQFRTASQRAHGQAYLEPQLHSQQSERLRL
jgi:hypothetical protein